MAVDRAEIGGVFSGAVGVIVDTTLETGDIVACAIARAADGLLRAGAGPGADAEVPQALELVIFAVPSTVDVVGTVTGCETFVGPPLARLDVGSVIAHARRLAFSVVLFLVFLTPSGKEKTRDQHPNGSTLHGSPLF